MPLKLLRCRTLISKHRSSLLPAVSLSTTILPHPAATSPYFPILNPKQSSPSSSIPEIDAALISSSFKEWFKTSSPPSIFDQIFQTLAELSDSEDSTIDRALSLLPLRLDESFVLQALRHSPKLPYLPKTSASNNFLLLRLKFFDWAGRQLGFRHTRATYHCIFRLLSRARLMSVVHDWLQALSESRLQSSGHYFSRRHIRFHEILVVGYAVAGKPDIALQMFGKMRFQGLDLSPFSYHVLLNSLIEESAFDVADTIFSQIAARGLSCPFTSCIRIKSLCKQNRVDEAIKYVEDLDPAVLEDNFISDHTIGILVTSLCKLRRFEEAGNLVEAFGSSRGYDVWIRDLIEAGRTKKALDFLAVKKESEGYVPHVFFYNILLCRLLRENRLDETYELLIEMRDNDIVPDKTTMNCVLCFFCKAGMVDVALMLYKLRLEFGLYPNRLAFRNLINAACAIQNAGEISQLLKDSLEHGFFPGKKTFWALLKVLYRDGRLEIMQDLFETALKEDSPTSGPAWSYYISAYVTALCNSNKPDEGYSVLEKVTRSNYLHSGFIFASLIRGYIALRRGDMVCKLFVEMLEKGYSPTRGLYKEVICCLCESGSYEKVLSLLENQLAFRNSNPRRFYNYFIYGAGWAGKPELAVEMLRHMKNGGIDPNSDTYMVMLSSFLNSNRISEALNFFYGLCKEREPSNRLYNLLIAGLAKARKLDQALFFWNEARSKKMVPSLQCYEELILAFSSFGEYDSLVKVLRDFEETGRQVSPFICNLLILHSLKHAHLRKTWDSMRSSSESPRGLMLGQLISAFSGGVRIKEHLHRLDEVMEKFFPVDAFTYNILLRALSMEGRMDLAREMFDRLERKGLVLNRYTYDVILHGLCKQGKREEAEVWKNKMVSDGFYPTWYTIELYNSTKRRDVIEKGGFSGSRSNEDHV